MSDEGWTVFGTGHKCAIPACQEKPTELLIIWSGNGEGDAAWMCATHLKEKGPEA